MNELTVEVDITFEELESILEKNNFKIKEIYDINDIYFVQKNKKIDIANKIDTFNISIRPHEDCCTVYVPRHPQIKPRLDVCIKEENKFNFKELINKAVEKTEHVTLNTKRKYQVVEDEIDIF